MPGKRRLRVGVIGAGGFAEVCHVPGLQSHPAVDVVALCGRRAEHARAMADRLGVPDVHTDYRELLAREDLDAVTITTPNHVHAEQSIAAHRAGKHVFCEKPLGMNPEEVRQMLAAARASGRIHMVAFTFRYTLGVRELRRRVQAGDLGEPYLVRLQYDGWSGLSPEMKVGWRDRLAEGGGGMLYDMGSHLFDLAAFVLGPIDTATGWTHLVPRRRPDRQTGKMVEVETDDIASATFRHASGAHGQWLMSRATPAHVENGYLQVVGREGALQATLSRGNVERLLVSRPSRPAWEEIRLDEAAYDGAPHALGTMMRAFADACLRGRADGDLDATYEDGLACQQALRAVELAGAHVWSRVSEL